MSDVDICKVSSPHEMDACFTIRHVVFVEGQNVPLDRELDGLDAHEDCLHYLLRLEGRPVGTARVRLSKDAGKIERVAILPDVQGMGLGHKLMRYIVNDLRSSKGVQTAKLSSQTHAIAFYEALGFEATGEIYPDAGIPHRDMFLDL